MDAETEARLRIKEILSAAQEEAKKFSVSSIINFDCNGCSARCQLFGIIDSIHRVEQSEKIYNEAFEYCVRIGYTPEIICTIFNKEKNNILRELETYYLGEIHMIIISEDPLELCPYKSKNKNIFAFAFNYSNLLGASHALRLIK